MNHEHKENKCPTEENKSDRNILGMLILAQLWLDDGSAAQLLLVFFFLTSLLGTVLMLCYVHSEKFRPGLD